MMGFSSHWYYLCLPCMLCFLAKAYNRNIFIVVYAPLTKYNKKLKIKFVFFSSTYICKHHSFVVDKLNNKINYHLKRCIV